MKNVIVFTASCLTLMAAFYLLVAFTNAEIDFTKWDKETRAMCSILLFPLSLIGSIAITAYFDDEKPVNQ